MHRIAIAIAALLAVEGAAIACVCVPPGDEEQKRETAQRIASSALAVAEVIQVKPINHEAMQPEQYRVLRVHVGTAPETFRLARQMSRTPGGEVQMVMTSCDYEPDPGKPSLVTLYARGEAPSEGNCSVRSHEQAAQPASLTIGSICDHLFLKSEGALDLIREEARKLKRQ